uniref:Uncharacterized protein n=1 Tax=Arundo donax TaxID=35708 RepID=A0A0A9CDM4_ARUDO
MQQTRQLTNPRKSTASK